MRTFPIPDVLAAAFEAALAAYDAALAARNAATAFAKELLK